MSILSSTHPTICLRSLPPAIPYTSRQLDGHSLIAGSAANFGSSFNPSNRTVIALVRERLLKESGRTAAE